MHLPRGRFNLVFAMAVLSSLLCMAFTTTAHAQSGGWAYDNPQTGGSFVVNPTNPSGCETWVPNFGCSVQLTVGVVCDIVTGTDPTATFYASTTPGGVGTKIGTATADGQPNGSVFTWVLPTNGPYYISAYITAEDYGNDGNCSALSSTPVSYELFIPLP